MTDVIHNYSIMVDPEHRSPIQASPNDNYVYYRMAQIVSLEEHEQSESWVSHSYSALLF